ncbi:MAG: bifunctional diaminohydroxyphosphoribosylaminopyrimidine deaminase/5-amino-6-(5-phosphoribosylamino)uracil reductase RibD [Cardiobacteriaceae bacterium]|nr:bifunctional diaminohydroxyphosphoribosylaminopyrimidine deaminase/5-amino-6-(5-phosphoribosylamino)uracil reductase RibD [Cardiobacteriaceae bacterium]
MKEQAFSEEEKYFARLALNLAKQGIFSTDPNPKVGCVLVRDGKIIGAGFHARAGEAHAEINALKMAKDAHGATAFVTLEPCAHHGRTPPCADALIKAGITKVVACTQDPNPKVEGGGFAKLKAAGITVKSGIFQEEAWELNRAFFQRIATNKPRVIVKIAASLDGRTALANGESKWITGEIAREEVQRERLMSDCVLAGSSSVIFDNARLNARYQTALPQKQPLRVIIDSQLRSPPDAAVFSINSPLLLATSKENAVSPSKKYPDFVKILGIDTNPQGKIKLDFLIQELGKLEINRIFVEAGANLTSALIKDNLVDELHLYLAPILLGHTSRPLFLLDEINTLNEKISFSVAKIDKFGEDLRLILLPKNIVVSLQNNTAGASSPY